MRGYRRRGDQDRRLSARSTGQCPAWPPGLGPRGARAQLSARLSDPATGAAGADLVVAGACGLSADDRVDGRGGACEALADSAARLSSLTPAHHCA